ncbi:MAG: hypothetical protein E7562_05605 [Ruminococcaceae bacterium]|nr:hypothetical protein [Oscillospiraceae bacterium]
MKRKIGFSIGALQKKYGDIKALEIASQIGADAVDFSIDDNDTFTDQHKIPMTGTINWNDVFDALDEIGYSGVYNMELNLRHFGNDFLIETAEFAVKVMKNILFERYG